MKTLIKVTLTFVLFLDMTVAFSQGPGGVDPAAKYAVFLGYKIEIRKDNYGNEYGVCIFPDNSECNEGDFFRGTCGQQYSYCALKGCDTKTKIEDKGGYTIQYTVCCCKDSLGIIQEIPLFDFMTQHGDILFDFQKNK